MEEKETKKEKARESQESEGEEEEERISQDKEETHRRETRAPSGGFFSRLNTWWLSFQRDKYIKAINRSYEDEWFIALDISGDTTQQKEQKIQREYYIRRELFGFKRQKEREQERQEEKQRLKRERKGKRLYLEQGETKSRTEFGALNIFRNGAIAKTPLHLQCPRQPFLQPQPTSSRMDRLACGRVDHNGLQSLGSIQPQSVVDGTSNACPLQCPPWCAALLRFCTSASSVGEICSIPLPFFVDNSR
ncbi:histone-lysine N-methyltransferase, H3 lysine-79 specific-like isoform X1 [Siniperca chuatsi]|uniref:histone-lysine N-methyltransferase, H3 lysine-79 specific-like isoform X1 n=1 Tax=Siniperca chuatsi TaxID=119488 RepID=UPI001CE02B96|nr:histone-lysine N-methyltransferase, H3 lysine-79 specific-like isoform X1 [Siniperca chuatsi]